jgi:predicted aspartyl protease
LLYPVEEIARTEMLAASSVADGPASVYYHQSMWLFKLEKSSVIVLVIAVCVAGCYSTKPASSELVATTEGSALTIVDGVPIVDVTVNGQYTSDFAFDTGSPGITIDESLARRRGIVLMPTLVKLDVAGASGLKTELSTLDEFGVSTAEFKRVDALWTDLSPLRTERNPRATNGILGWEIFKGQTVVIDYERKTILVTRNSLAEPDGRQIFPLRVENGHLFTTISVAGRQVCCLIDTAGAPGTAWIDTAVAGDISTGPLYAGKHSEDRAFHQNFTGVGEVDYIQLGCYRFDNPLVVVAEHSNLTSPGEGIIGPDFLSHFVVTFDFINMRMQLELSGTEVPNDGTKVIFAGPDRPTVIKGHYIYNRTEIRGVMTLDPNERALVKWLP